MSYRRLVVVGALLLYCAAPAAAQAVKIAFHDGRVDLSADNAPLSTVLAEWSRVGGTKIVNAERVIGAPVTLQLNNVPERTALDVLLRTVSGYMAGPRQTAASGQSAFESILIVPTSSAPVAPVRPAPVAAAPQPSVPQIDPNDPEENPPTDVAPGQPRPVAGPQQRIRRLPGAITGPGVIGGVIGPNGQPIQQVQPDPEDQPPPEERPETSTPSNPFGLPPGVGSARPGEISPVPQQQQQEPQPRQPQDDPEP